MQHDPAYRDVLTYPSPATGDPVATSFLVPRTAEDLAKRGQAFKVWAGRSLGMLGRTPDYLNSALMALAAAADWFAQADPRSATTSGIFTERSVRTTCCAPTRWSRRRPTGRWPRASRPGAR